MGSDWISKSQHTLGQACDIEIPGMPTLELADWVTKHLEFDQVICECYDPGKGPNSGRRDGGGVEPRYF